jgi:hypothetical protein
MRDEEKKDCSYFIPHPSALIPALGGPPETRTQPSCLQDKCAAINTSGPFVLFGPGRRIPTFATSSQDSDALSLHHTRIENRLVSQEGFEPSIPCLKGRCFHPS